MSRFVRTIHEKCPCNLVPNFLDSNLNFDKWPSFCTYSEEKSPRDISGIKKNIYINKNNFLNKIFVKCNILKLK